MRFAVDAAWVLWTAGTIPAASSPAVSIPFLMFTQYNVEPDAAFGGWLMPVVPPMVAAATDAAEIPHMAPGTGRQTMLYGCCAIPGLSLVASLIIISMIWASWPCTSLRRGPRGCRRCRSCSARWARSILPWPACSRCQRGAGGAARNRPADGGAFAILYGVPVWGFAVLWIALATALTVLRTLRRGMPFTLTWWSLTFPVTFVTGTT